MVIDAALSEECDILEVIVVVDDMIKVSMTFTANVLKRFDVEACLGRVLGAAFGINFAVFDDGLEPGKVFVVMSDNELNVLRFLCCGRGGSP